jgi:hypothetical protein
MLALSRFSKQLILKFFQQHKTRKAKNCSKSAFLGLDGIPNAANQY